MPLIGFAGMLFGLALAVVGFSRWFTATPLDDAVTPVYTLVGGVVAFVVGGLVLALTRVEEAAEAGPSGSPATPSTLPWPAVPPRLSSPGTLLPPTPPVGVVELGGVVAERHFELEPRGRARPPVVLRVGQPIPHDLTVWVCPWELQGLSARGDQQLHLSFGADSLAALDAALHAAPSVIEEEALAESVVVLWDGHHRLGFGKHCVRHLRERRRFRRQRRERGTVVIPVRPTVGARPNAAGTAPES